MFDECARIMFSNPNRIELLPTRQDNIRINNKKMECNIVVKVDFDKIKKGLIIEINVKDRFYETIINQNIFYMNRFLVMN